MNQENQAAGLTVAQTMSIELLYRAFSEKNPALLTEALAEDWQDIPLGPGQSPGPNGLADIVIKLTTAFPDLEIIVDDIVGNGDRAGVRARITGTHLGTIFGIEPTGRKVTIALHEFHRFSGLTITHTWHLEDWFGMLHQIGMWPPFNRNEEPNAGVNPLDMNMATMAL